MDPSIKVVRRPRKAKASAWTSVANGASTIFDIVGTSSRGRLMGFGSDGSLADDSKRLEGDVRALGKDFIPAIRSTVGR